MRWRCIELCGQWLPGTVMCGDDVFSDVDGDYMALSCAVTLYWVMWPVITWHCRVRWRRFQRRRRWLHGTVMCGDGVFSYMASDSLALSCAVTLYSAVAGDHLVLSCAVTLYSAMWLMITWHCHAWWRYIPLCGPLLPGTVMCGGIVFLCGRWLTGTVMCGNIVFSYYSAMWPVIAQYRHVW